MRTLVPVSNPPAPPPPPVWRPPLPPPATTRYSAVRPALGVTLLLAAVYAPVPIALIAATRNTYAVPFVSPVTVWLAVADAARENVVHVEPPLLEN